MERVARAPTWTTADLPTSKCHGDMGFMDKELSLGTVKFVHAKHLQFDKKKQAVKEKELGT